MTADATLRAKIQLDDSGVKKIAPSFNQATNAAKQFETTVTRAGSAVTNLATKLRTGLNASASNFQSKFQQHGGIRGGAGFAAANFAFNQVQAALPQEGVGGMVGSGLSNAAAFGTAGFMAGGPIGAAIGVAVSAVVTGLGNFRKALEETTAAAQAASASLAKEHQRTQAEFETLRALREVDTQGFGASEIAALNRLIAEQTAILRGSRTEDTNDTQTLGDEAIVELARIRELAERQAKYFESTGYNAEILRRSQSNMSAGSNYSTGRSY